MLDSYILEGLHCADCGEKIRKAACEFEGIDSAHLNLARGVLTLDGSEQNRTHALQQLCNSIESGITVKRVGDSKPQQSHSSLLKEFWQIGLAALLIIAAIILGALNFNIVRNIMLTAATLVAVFKPALMGIKGVIREGSLDENFLLTLAAISALFIGEYIEAAAVTLLFAVGEIIESRVTAKSRKSIEKLSEIRPDTVHTDNGDRPAAQIKVGEIIIAHPYERIALDGIVVGGSGQIDASAITGESIPLTAEYGTEVLGGMTAGAGMLRIQVTGDYENSAAARIIKLVEESESRKGNAQRFITRFAKVYTPLMVILALLITVTPWIVTGTFSVDWLRKALVFLVASCPCALVISVPLAFYAGVGAASRKGVLIKGGVHLENLAKAHCIAFDKTGTLTTGELEVTNIHSADGYDPLAIGAGAEQYSHHPVATAIKKACKTPAKLDGEITELAGYGVAVKGEQTVFVGAKRLMEKENIDTSNMPDGQVYVAVDGVCVGVICLADKLREDARQTIKSLKNAGIKQLALLSGDSNIAVESVAKECDIDFWQGQLLPQDKVTALNKLKSSHKSVVFVGDGINDAPVLTEATVGVAMGLGTDAATHTADAVLSSGNLKDIEQAIKISRRTVSTVKTNIALALGVKAAVMVSAFFVPMMWAAVVADVVLSVVCCLNSASLLKSRQ
ncbi:MAG: cadmium-translocating P-type ATPase [Clostridia bacterium]|nr:cadmium-translocating P-type ATPase [Clostridia bacterium]